MSVSDQILVRARLCHDGQILFSYWSPDLPSAENELQRLMGCEVDVDLVRNGKVIKSYRR